MIIHKLIAHHLKHKDDPEFYRYQARDAIHWIQKGGGRIGPGVRALDLGCGHGIFGAELAKLGCEVVFSDETNHVDPSLKGAEFRKLDLEKEEISALGQFDLVICSNVLEHLSDPGRLLRMIPGALRPGGVFFLSWTNWLSPWGGHEFSPYHYLGPTRGHLFFDRIKGIKRLHTPFVNLFPTYIGKVLKQIRQIQSIEVIAAAPRYYPEFSAILWLPVIREFLTWNCAVLIKKSGA